MDKNIRVYAKRVGEPWEICIMPNKLKSMQRFVGGYIETVKLRRDGSVLVCNDEGRINGMEYNITICGTPIFGDCFVCGSDGAEFANVPFGYDSIGTYLKPEFQGYWRRV